MTTDGQEPTTQTPQAGKDTQPATTPQPGNDTQAPQMFPLDYVQQLRQEAASYRTKYKEFEEQQAKQREKELADQNEWKKLADERAAKLAELEPTAQGNTASI